VRYRLILAAALMVGTGTAHAQSAAAPAVPIGQLHVSGSFRVRYEAIGGQARAGFNGSDGLTSLRTTLLTEYRASEAIRFALEIYDSRTYGADRLAPLTNNEANAIEPVQAYVAASFGNAGSGTKVDVQAGRFLLNLGSRRLVAADDYRNTTTGYTGLHAELARPGGTRATLIYTLPQQRRPDTFDSLHDNKVVLDREDLNLVLWGGILAQDKAIGAAMAELSFFHLGEDDVPGRPNRNRSLDTVGGRVIRAPATSTLDYEIEGFYQWGSIRSSVAANAGTLDVSAWFLHAEAGYTLPGTWKPHVSIEYDEASGDGPGGRFGRFDTLFGMRRGDFAPSGIHDVEGVVAGKPLRCLRDDERARRYRRIGRLCRARGGRPGALLAGAGPAALRVRWRLSGEGPVPEDRTQHIVREGRQICVVQHDGELLKAAGTRQAAAGVHVHNPGSAGMRIFR
jgi:hypothetical protein